MNTLGAWFQKAFPLDERPIGGAYMEAEATEDKQALARESAARWAIKLKAEATAPTRDEFAAWRDDSVTQFVMRALQRNAEECHERWLQASWEGGQADQRLLDSLRERHDALMGFTSRYEDFCAVLGLEPQDAERAA